MPPRLPVEVALSGPTIHTKEGDRYVHVLDLQAAAAALLIQNCHRYNFTSIVGRVVSGPILLRSAGAGYSGVPVYVYCLQIMRQT